MRDLPHRRLQVRAADEPAQRFTRRCIQIRANRDGPAFRDQRLGGGQAPGRHSPSSARRTAADGRDHQAHPLRTSQRPLLATQLRRCAEQPRAARRPRRGPPFRPGRARLASPSARRSSHPASSVSRTLSAWLAFDSWPAGVRYRSIDLGVGKRGNKLSYAPRPSSRAQPIGSTTSASKIVRFTSSGSPLRRRPTRHRLSSSSGS